MTKWIVGLLAALFIATAVPAEITRDKFNLGGVQKKYLTYDEGVARAKAEKKNLLVARKIPAHELEAYAKLAEKYNNVFAVAADNDTRVPEGISEHIFVGPKPPCPH